MKNVNQNFQDQFMSEKKSHYMFVEHLTIV